MSTVAPATGTAGAATSTRRPGRGGDGVDPSRAAVRRRRWWKEVGWRHVVGIIAVVYALVPVVYLLSASVNPIGSVVSTDLFPTRVSLGNYADLFNNPSRPFARWFLNTLVIAVVVVVAQLFASSLAAYAFSRFRFTGRRGGLLTLLLIQLFPQFLAAVALYQMFTGIGEVAPAIGLDTLPGYILVMMGGALGQVWLIKGFFDSIPVELDEAAKIDGAGHAQVFFQVILPLVRPILATTGLLVFVGVFGEFILASIFLRETEIKTVAVGLYGVLDADRSNNLGWFAAASVIVSIPVVLLFQYLQKYIVGGITAGAVKG
ncbi:sugar ABC transporter permease [Cellulomonas marina]|uniref:Arabinogalactan oligomer / maltooligosaccharide transport system permease protein n=1 Tax=Cellulomonas marina TaxID=988821 RepID=A0A1I0VWP6_9CELL|nr:sugar ABC transporter permease [Cellulomonas marina]GIG27506.1 sugar ABC transporter permease [Cellulomonas marina]SFA80618.1 arabinogalactan oligomer / maltooligosaccharide transport system permease protein [Cellulomonas marina]